MTDIKIEKSYHPNGKLEWQATTKNGKPIGVVRHWYENGVLERECPCDDEGLEHGLVKDWNKEGKLLGESNMDHGTGIRRSWFSNDQLESEIYYVRGKCCGRSRMWWEDGGLMSVNYYVKGRKVSKKKYDEACETDLTLPRYKDDDLESEPTMMSPKYKKRETPVSELERQQHNDFINKFLKQPNRGEARQWLAGDENRNIGEMAPEESREYVEEGYKAGATKILAVEIEGDTTNCLIVYLPSNGAKRKRVFEWNGESAQKSSFDPYEDWGQNELFAYFS
jgi:antitoxin component YwqK of YwqJK toxin-antitoxin module